MNYELPEWMSVHNIELSGQIKPKTTNKIQRKGCSGSLDHSHQRVQRPMPNNLSKKLAKTEF